MMKGFHEMLVNLIFAVIMDPKESLNNHVTLAFLGSVSQKLKEKCDWSNVAYQTAIQACKKSSTHKDTSFLRSFYDENDLVHGPYIRLVVAEIEDMTIPSEMYENTVTKELLDVSFGYYNRRDSEFAIIASELADLHLNDKGMSTFDAFTEGSLRNEFLKY